MPTTPDVWNSMPKVIREYFPVVLTEKSRYTKIMYDFIETELLQGVNFMKLSEGMASLNMREFCRRKQLYAVATRDDISTSDNINVSEFYENSIFSFPSNDLLMNIFLTNFKEHSHIYDEHRNGLTAGHPCNIAPKPWNHLQEAIQKSAVTTFRRKTSKNYNLFDAKSVKLTPVIEAKRAALAEYKRSPSVKTLQTLRSARNKVQQT